MEVPQIEGSADVSESAGRRNLILRDSLTFLTLTIITTALFAVTLFLFRSFASHRTELGRRWSDRGRAALQQHQPEQAIAALRTALTYAPGERTYELLLAQALEQAGHTEESYNYFSGLWDAEPGSGQINFELARLAAEKKDKQAAINFYRASLYGTWDGDGVVRRRTVRLELIRYLLQQQDATAAHAELLVAQGNAADSPALASEVGPLLEQMGDLPEARNAYLRWAQAEPGNPHPLAAAGRLAYSMGDFVAAQHLLQEALRTKTFATGDDQIDRAGPTDLLHRVDRILELIPSRKLALTERVSRLLTLRNLALKRLDQCSAMPGGLPPSLFEISNRWQAVRKASTRGALLRDTSRQDDLLQLIYDTEAQADNKCGAAVGDDALLVLLSRNPSAVSQ